MLNEGSVLPPGVDLPPDFRRELADGAKTVIFEKGRSYEGLELNGVAFTPVEKMPDWQKVQDAALADEPEFALGPNEQYLRRSAGVIVLEPDGRVWIYEPKNHFGGYEHTYPKGRPEKGLTMQQAARKEVLEETGLMAEITGFLGDYAKTTTKTRYYLGRRTGGDPGRADSYRKPGEVEEVEAVKLVPLTELAEFLNMPIDQTIAEDLKRKLAEDKQQ